MCGIAGLWRADSMAESELRRSVDEMSSRLRHRGPDASGTVVDRGAGIAFAHRRLAILDLSERGGQPMWSRSGRYCIVYNGEVYNAPEIKAEMDKAALGVAWRGHSDTEVVLESIEAFGLEPAVDRFHGMFAFALWDTATRRLSLVRDRLGIKPLLYVQGAFGVAFVSELQALIEVPGFRPRLDLGALGSFLRYGVVPGDRCIIEGVRKVQPGTIVDFEGPRLGPSERCFWSAEQVATEGMRRPFEGSDRDAIDELERLLVRSVAHRMRSDVPFGAFLSGGIDSSAVVAAMQEVSANPVKTFCIGNTVAGYDESSHARAVAAHLGCEHHELLAEPSDMLAVVPEIASRWDEPFADSSQIPTYLVSRLTREHVTVSLSGDGGDELFAGYNRHAWAPRLWEVTSRFPKSARRALGALRWVGAEDWDKAFRAIGLGDVVRIPGDKLYKASELSEVETPHAFYDRLRSHWNDPGEVLASGIDPAPPSVADALQAPFAEQMMFYDLIQYLPDDILTKVDRASMSVSLEARVPLLDHDLVEFAWRLPRRLKIRGRTQKWILREVLARRLPRALFERPKTGFGVPVGQWLRGPLRQWGSDLLAAPSVEADGIFDSAVVTRTWDAHQAGRGNHEHQLWAVLMFQSWWARHKRIVET